MGQRYGSNIVREGLILCLDAANPRSYSGTGDTWYDVSKEKHEGTLTNGVLYDYNKLGSLMFDGVNDYIGNVAPGITESDFLNGEFTLSCWFKWLGGGGGSDGRNYILQDATSISYSLSLEINARDYTPPVFSTWEHTNEGSLHVNSSTVVEENKWYNFVVTRNSTSIIMFVNGSEIYSATRVPGSLIGFQGFNIGTHRDANNRWFNGNISNISIYNRALRAEEIQQNYQALRGRYGL